MRIVEIPVPGLAGPLAATPERLPGSARRTSHVDVVRAAPTWDSDTVLTAAAREVVTPAGGPPEHVAGATLRIETRGPAAAVAGIVSDPAEAALAEVLGTPLMAGFRKAAARAVPDHAARSSLLHRLLDDAPLAFLVSGHALTLEEPPQVAPEAAGPGDAEADGRQEARRRSLKPDLCAGWQVGGALLTVLEETGSLPHSLGPVAPELAVASDPLSWHDRPVLPARATRRSRRLDVVPGPAGAPVRVDVHFRDSYGDLEGTERSLHEYTLAVEADPATGVVLSASAVPRALPWTECPQAAASVDRLVGLALPDLPDLVRREFTGITTCTHLNDTMRSLADAWALLGMIRD